MEDNTNAFSGTERSEAPVEETAVSVGGQDTASDAEETMAPRDGKKVSAPLRRALVRCGVALLIAVALLAATRFAVFAIVKGPTESSSLESAQEGAFVKRDIYAVVGYAADEKSGSAVVGEYAVVPMDGKFVTVHMTKRYLTAADTVLAETKSYLEGSTTTLDRFFVVDGAVSKLTDAQKKSLSDWYTANKDYLVQTHVIDETADEATYLSDTLLEVDQIDGMSQILVIVLSALAGLCLCYVIVELILMACGYYLDSRVCRRLAKAEAVFAGATTEEIVERMENGGLAAAEAEDAPEAPIDTGAEDAPEEKE